MQTATSAAQAEVQKNKLNLKQCTIEQIKAQIELKKCNKKLHKKELMQLEFQMNMQLKIWKLKLQKGKEKEKEDRKDERTRIQASQQSELIDQRKSEKPPKNFESAGNDILGGGFDLGTFDPR